MDSASKAYDEINRRWNTTCRLVIGGEVGELEEFEEWLSELNEPGLNAKSFSGKEILLPSKNYLPNSKFTSLEEVDFNKKFEPLNINEIKDIDSIVEALQERFLYCGDIVLGNSKFIEKSANITDSFYIYNSHTVAYSNYVGFSTLSRYCENVFGSTILGYSNYCIWGKFGFKNMRCLEFVRLQNSADCNYGYNLHNCSNCFFSFNLHSRRNSIGNLELSVDKYSSVKKKLLEELRETLERTKRLPTLFELVGNSKPNSITLDVKSSSKGTQNKKELEDSFSRVTELIFHKKLEGLESYSPWLKKNVGNILTEKSILSGEPVLIGEFALSPVLTKNRLITEEESLAAESLHIQESEVNNLSLQTTQELLTNVAIFPGEFHFGTNENVIECDTSGFAYNCYRTSVARDARYVAYSWWPKDSNYIFGSRIVHDSSFCINCYDSTKLRCCFEVDSSRNCSGAYFCHNSENIQDGMFCFNAKNKIHSIGNTEFEKDKYSTIKEKLLAELVEELEQKKELQLGIYNLGLIANPSGEFHE